MVVLHVTVRVKPEHVGKFLDAARENAEHSARDEPGCLRFDVLQDNEDPNKIHLYEVYKDQAALDYHRQAPHFTKWRETVKDWFTAEIVRKLASPVFPPEADWS